MLVFINLSSSSMNCKGPAAHRHPSLHFTSTLLNGCRSCDVLLQTFGFLLFLLNSPLLSIIHLDPFHPHKTIYHDSQAQD